MVEKTYRIEGNFYMVQTFVVFADNPTTAKIKIAKSFNSLVSTALCRDFVAEIRTAKFSSGALGGIFAKFAPTEISRYTVLANHCCSLTFAVMKTCLRRIVSFARTRWKETSTSSMP